MPIRELYIEPSSRCNLSCAMCSRNYWEDESIGDLPYPLFEQLLREPLSGVRRVFFGGIGEPFVHPRILDMIAAVKALGHSCEIITNGTLLSEQTSLRLLTLGLDKLWISLDQVEGDGADSYGHQSDVVSNMRRFAQLRDNEDGIPYGTKLCVAFVLMKSNARQLDRLITLSHELGIDEIKVTHLLPYDDSMENEICYSTLLPNFGSGGTVVDLPFIESRNVTPGAVRDLLVQGRYGHARLHAPTRYAHCRFVHDEVAFVRWDGEVCPCMPLLHTNTVFQNGHSRKLRFCSFGNITGAPLTRIWNRQRYRDFRKRVQTFDFSPCATCGACGLFASNEEDCLGSPFPACGHCLWAYGLIQCP